MIVLADNDIVRKLACCDLYAEFMAAFGVESREIYVLSTARRVLTSPRAAKSIDSASLERLNSFLNSVAIISTAPNPAELAALTEQPTIDAGEAVLFSVAIQINHSLLATGDKKSLRSLAKSDDPICQNLRDKLSGRVVCFEQIISRILSSTGFESIRERLILARECDRVLSIILGSRLDLPHSEFHNGLISYISELRSNTAELLIER